MDQNLNHLELQPRDGIPGVWDKFIGPNATLAENLIALIPALIFAGLILYLSIKQGVEWSIGIYIIAIFLAFDMVGGIATNATTAAKLWYHRPGQTQKDHGLSEYFVQG